MKRFFLSLLFVLILVGVPLYLFLRESPALPPGPASEEVLRMAAQKSRVLQSVRLAVDGQFRLEGGSLPASGTVELAGILQDAGDSLQLEITADALVAPGGDRSQTFRVQGAGDIIVVGRKDLTFRIRSLSTEPDQSLFQPELLSLLLNQWWVLPAPADAEGAVPGGTLTPSPDILRAQSQVVRVVKDRGVTTLDGASVRHFDVVLDSAKLLAYIEQLAAARQETMDREGMARAIEDLQATGEMWIDAETFALRRVLWTIESLQTAQGVLSGSFTARLSEFDTAPVVTPPADARVLSPASFFGLTEVQQEPGATLSPEKLEQLRSLLEGSSAIAPTE